MITLLAVLAFHFIFSPVVFAQDASPEYSQVPEWAKRAVWYQIFPERFSNGDAANDPAVTDIAGSWPQEKPKRWRVSPWTSDWYKLQSWEAADTADNKGSKIKTALPASAVRARLNHFQMLRLGAFAAQQQT